MNRTQIDTNEENENLNSNKNKSNRTIKTNQNKLLSYNLSNLQNINNINNTHIIPYADLEHINDDNHLESHNTSNENYINNYYMNCDLTNLKYNENQVLNTFNIYTKIKKGFIFFYGSGHRNQWILPVHNKITKIIKLCSEYEAFFYAWLYLSCLKKINISRTKNNYTSILDNNETIENVSIQLPFEEREHILCKQFIKFTVPCYHIFLKRNQINSIRQKQSKQCKDDNNNNNHNITNNTFMDYMKKTYIEWSSSKIFKNNESIQYNDKINDGTNNMIYNSSSNEKKNNVLENDNSLYPLHINQNIQEEAEKDVEVEEEHKTAICLSNVLSSMRHPCVMDIKMGIRLYGDDCNEESIQKKIEKAKNRSCLSHGFHLTSLIGWSKKKKEPFFISKEDAHSIKNDDNFVQAFISYFTACDNIQLSILLIKKILIILEEMKIFFIEQNYFAFYGTSLLFVFDSDPSKKENEDNYSSKDKIEKNELTKNISLSNENMISNDEHNNSFYYKDKKNKLCDQDKINFEEILNFKLNIEKVFYESLSNEERNIILQNKLNQKIIKSVHVYIIDFAHASLNKNQNDEGFLLGIISLHRIMDKTIQRIKELYLSNTDVTNDTV